MEFVKVFVAVRVWSSLKNSIREKHHKHVIFKHVNFINKVFYLYLSWYSR